MEDFADCVTHVALGWHTFFTDPLGGDPGIGSVKYRYILDKVFDWKPRPTVAGSVAAWRTTFPGLLRRPQKEKDHESRRLYGHFNRYV